MLVTAIVVMVTGFGLVVYLLRRSTSSSELTQAISSSQAALHQRLDKAAQSFQNLSSELGKMQQLGQSLRDIQDSLKSPKLRGNIGEQLMAELIKQQIPRHNYHLQHAFRSGEKVDAVIRTKNGLIPIDAKFPNENFLKMVQAKDDEVKNLSRKEFVKDVKKHIAVIGRKYIVPAEGTVDFALMYVPGEAAYYEIITNTDLSDYGAQQRVYLVSPQSFYYFLQTVLLGLEGELIEAKAKEVMNYLKAIQGDARRFNDDLGLVDKHLTNAKRASDSAITSYQKLSGKIDSANQLSSDTTKKLESADDVVETIESGGREQ